MNASDVDNYIVRIYRGSPGMLVGVVETAPEECTLFHSYAELVAILARGACSDQPSQQGSLEYPGGLQ